MFGKSLDFYMPKSTVEHLHKWGETTRIFDESVTGFGGIGHAFVREQLIDTGMKVRDRGEIKPVYKYSRDVKNERGEGYPYFELNKLAIIREYEGDFVLDTFDDVADMTNWVTLITKF